MDGAPGVHPEPGLDCWVPVPALQPRSPQREGAVGTPFSDGKTDSENWGAAAKAA